MWKTFVPSIFGQCPYRDGVTSIHLYDNGYFFGYVGVTGPAILIGDEGKYRVTKDLGSAGYIFEFKDGDAEQESPKQERPERETTNA